MNSPAPHFRLTAPPFETFPDQPHATVQAAFDWLITERRADRLLETEPSSADDGQAFFDRITEVLTRVGTDLVVAWLAMTWASTLIAHDVGAAAEGFWELPRGVFPPDDELHKPAAELLRLFLDTKLARAQLDHVCTAVLGDLKATAEDVLNDVCGDRCPAPTRDLSGVERVWALKALVSVLLSLREEHRNVMRGVSQCDRYTGPGVEAPTDREDGS